MYITVTYASELLPDGGDDQVPGLFSINAGRNPHVSDIVNCASCIGACCRAGMVLELDSQEARSLEEAGTVMHQATPANLVSRTIGRYKTRGNRTSLYKLDSDCGNLDPDNNQCNAYEGRPVACRALVVGGLRCQVARNTRGLPIDLGMPQLRKAY
jgi:Fe-S-cluster containining protein